MRAGERGSALLTVMIVLVVVTLLGAGIIVASGKNFSNAKSREQSVGLSNCAQAVRNYIGSQITSKAGFPQATVGGQTVSTMSFTVPGTPTAITLQGGHYDDATSVVAFTLPAAATFGATGGSSIQNLANALPLGVGASATQVRGTARCIDAGGRTYEVEFSYIGG